VIPSGPFRPPGPGTTRPLRHPLFKEPNRDIFLRFSIGPDDLSLSLGISGELKQPRMGAAYERVIAACRRHGVAPEGHLMDLEWAGEWTGKGVRFPMYYLAIRFLMQAVKNAARRLREIPSPKK
jgi:hypothetical protein